MFNVPIYIAGQLWFLYALLYDYILFALAERWKLRRLAYLAIPVGIAAYILMAQGLYLLGHPLSNLFYRNFLIEGFPLFALGFWIHAHKDRIKASGKALLCILVVSTLLCPVERLLLGRDFGVNIVTFPQVTALFLLCLKHTDKSACVSGLVRLGRQYSMYVYIFHPAVWHLLEKLYGALKIDGNNAALYAMPILVLLISVLISVLFLKGKMFLRDRILIKKV